MTRLQAADARFTVATTPIPLSEFRSICRPFFTSLGSPRNVRVFVCGESSIQGFVSSTPVSSPKSVFTVFVRDERTLSTDLSTSSFSVSVVPVSLRLARSSANVASASLLMTSSSTVSSRKWPPVFLCASRFCLSSKLQTSSLCLLAPLHLFVFRWLLCGCLSSRFHALLVLQVEHEGQVQEGCPMSSTVVSVVSRQLLQVFFLTSCARRFNVRFARAHIPLLL